MEISNEDLTIQSAAPDDAALLCRWWNDGEVMAHAGFPDGLHASEAKVREELIAVAGGPLYQLIIEAGSTPAGEMHYRDQGGGVAENGVKICDAMQRGERLWDETAYNADCPSFCL